jgi:thymidylate synthase (FAD)
MILVKPSITKLWITPNVEQVIELAGRTCYKSEDKIKEGSSEVFIKKIIANGHEAMIEHASASYRVICDRGVTHEIVRHRLFSYAQESTRYCNYKGGVTFILPPWVDISTGNYSEFCMDNTESNSKRWFNTMIRLEDCYIRMLQNGWKPQEARSVLPNSLKTEIVITGNLREWRHFFKLRTAKTAHPQMQEVANMLLKDIKVWCPTVFADFVVN